MLCGHGQHVCGRTEESARGQPRHFPVGGPYTVLTGVMGAPVGDCREVGDEPGGRVCEYLMYVGGRRGSEMTRARRASWQPAESGRRGRAGAGEEARRAGRRGERSDAHCSPSKRSHACPLPPPCTAPCRWARPVACSVRHPGLGAGGSASAARLRPCHRRAFRQR